MSRDHSPPLLALLTIALLGCARPAREGARTPAGDAPRAPVTLTHLGVAGWQITDGRSVVLIDPYWSRPALSEHEPVVSDEQAVAAHAPPRADLILVGHSHVDHLLDVPSVARATGAQVMGSASSTSYARAAGLPADKLITVEGGEDFQFRGFSVRVLPSLHSALDHKHGSRGARHLPLEPTLPLTFAQFVEGGTFAYLVRISGREIVILSSANYIERELEGLRPEIAIVATGLREEIYDYSCRLMRALGSPRLVLVNHFDDWRAPLDPPLPLAAETERDLAAFRREISGCAPETQVLVPERFAPISVE